MLCSCISLWISCLYCNILVPSCVVCDFLDVDQILVEVLQMCSNLNVGGYY